MDLGHSQGPLVNGVPVVPVTFTETLTCDDGTEIQLYVQDQDRIPDPPGWNRFVAASVKGPS